MSLLEGVSSNCTYCDRSSHTLEVIFLAVEGSLIFLINATFLFALYRRRRSINWKSTVFVANVAVSDLLCSFSLLVTAANVLEFKISSIREETLEYIIRLVTTYSTGITVLNYTALFFIQYFSIRKPLVYRTRCTRTLFVHIVIGQWAFVTGYVALKAIMIKRRTAQLRFSIAELILMALSTLFSLIIYAYVLYVSGANVMQHSVRRANGGNSKSGQQLSRRRVVCGGLMKEYRNTVTAGLHCLVYLATFTPIWVVRMVVLVAGCPDHRHYGDRTSIYSCGCVACRVTLYVWYLRAIIDPLLQFVREPQLFEEMRRWARQASDVVQCGKESGTLDDSQANTHPVVIATDSVTRTTVM